MRLDTDMLERVRNAIWATGRGLTITGICEDALNAWLKEAEHKNGGPFDQREGEIKNSPKKSAE